MLIYKSPDTLLLKYLIGLLLEKIFDEEKTRTHFVPKEMREPLLVSNAFERAGMIYLT